MRCESSLGRRADMEVNIANDTIQTKGAKKGGQ
jgi:hypothetical protein